MSRSKIKKCGNFMEKDGIVVKRPGKRFVCPPMPARLSLRVDNLAGVALDDTLQMNAIREWHWRKNRIAEYKAMKRLYYFQELIRFIRKTSNTMVRLLSANGVRPIQPDTYVSLHTRTHET
ncbi:MAG: hypothetical protein SPL08_00775 [Pseudomonadota bacterium]|nr:hypothetical protein [Pseudomonadota bacterium]